MAKKKNPRMLKSHLLLAYIICSLAFIGGFSLIGKAQDELLEEDESIITEPEDAIVLLSGDIIKNFKLDTFAGTPIDVNNVYGNKLIFETQGLWRLEKENLELRYKVQTPDNNVYLFYQMLVTNKINIKTNIPYQECVPRITYASDNFETLDFKWTGLGDDVRDEFSVDMTWTHPNLNLQGTSLNSYNTKHIFSGNLEMTFDINDNPLPPFLRDELGDQLTKEFDHIAIRDAYVLDADYGWLGDQPPDINTIVNEPMYRSDLGGDTEPPTNKEGTRIPMSASPSPSTPFVKESFDGGIRFQSIGSTLFPRNKDGSDIWSPVNNGSQKDARITLNIGALSPVAFRYAQTISYNWNRVRQRDQWFSFDPCFDVARIKKSITGDVAVSCNNRYIQMEIGVLFDVWSKWHIEIGEGFQIPELEKPIEYYDNLTWSSIIDGAEGSIFVSDRVSILEGLFGSIFGDIGDWLLIIIIVIVAIIFIIIIMSFIKRRRLGTKGMREQKRQAELELEIERQRLEMETKRAKIEIQRRQLQEALTPEGKPKPKPDEEYELF